MNQSPPRIPLLLVVAADVGARALFLSLADPRAISTDLRGWEHVAAALAAGQNPYSTTTFLNWPPLWMQILFGLERLASATQVPLVRLIQIFLIACEAGLLVAADRLMARLPIRRRRLLLLAGIALNPICILLTCQHGNFDGLVALAVTLFLYWLVRFEQERDSSHWLAAALFLGIAVTLKTAPAVLAPLLCSRVRTLPAATRAIGAFLAFAPALYGLSVLFALGPDAVARQVLGHRSVSGWFGVTGLLHWLGRDEWSRAYGVVFPLILGVALALLAVSLWRRPAAGPRQIVLWSLLLLAAIPFLGSGYGPQYLYWFWIPLLVSAAAGSPGLQKAAGAFAAVALLTYAAEYALMESLGAFLLRAHPSPPIQLAALLLRTNRGAAAVNGPLFLAYAFLFAAAARELSRLRQREA